MSFNVRIRTKFHELNYQKLMDDLKEYGFNPSILYSDETSCTFYQPKISTRAIDISEEDNGYDVVMSLMASREDFKMFAVTLSLINTRTYGEGAFIGDDVKVKSIIEDFDSHWIDQQMKCDINICIDFILNKQKKYDRSEHEICLFCPVRTFYLGKRVLSLLGITHNTYWRKAHKLITKRIRFSQYSKPATIISTSTNIQIDVAQKGKKKDMRSVTIYDLNKFDMISKAEYFLLLGEMNKEIQMLTYEDFMKVAPKEWIRYDNCQYFTTPLSIDDFLKFWESAKPYNVIQEDKTNGRH